jgi:hypothetical protein
MHFKQHARTIVKMVPMVSRVSCFLVPILALGVLAAATSTTSASDRLQHHNADPARMLNATHYGYLDVNATLGSRMFYMFYEARKPTMHLEETPIILWLQVHTRRMEALLRASAHHAASEAALVLSMCLPHAHAVRGGISCLACLTLMLK